MEKRKHIMGHKNGDKRDGETGEEIMELRKWVIIKLNIRNVN